MNTLINCFYYWKGVDQYGKLRKGRYLAPSEHHLQQQLISEQISLIKARRLPCWLTKWLRRPLTLTQRYMFVEQLATSLNAGMSLHQTLNILHQRYHQKNLKTLIQQLISMIEEGKAFSTALEQSKQFPILYSQLIKTGERSGKLPEIFIYLSEHLKRQLSLRRKLINSLSYPTIVIIMTSLTLIFMLHFIIPKFTSLFNELHTPIPAYTQWILDVSQHLQILLPYILVTVSISAFTIYVAQRRWPNLRHIQEKVIFEIPMLGKILLQSQQQRINSILMTTYTSGLPIMQGLNCAYEASNNGLFQTKLKETMKLIHEGDSFYAAASQMQLLTRDHLQLLMIGEESGTLDKMLVKITELGHEELMATTEVLVNLIEPLVMAVVGLVIGVIVVAIYLPIFDLGRVIH
ncbi:MAG: Putative type II secretion system protein F [Candidatus Celerinatantimonas neptuna]|nr:MAG: Putative type II secretion system protein F [Candidatus Celerinatantimonas neptuna]